MQIAFYHLEQARVEDALPKLLEKAVGAGYRAMVRVDDEARLELLDECLWTYNKASFLAHGRSGEKNSAVQPILLTLGDEVENSANLLVLIGGPVPHKLEAFERCLYMFEGQQADALQVAREQWRDLKAQGHEVTYWQQNEDGAWKKKA